jgi:hypothetical protein
MFLFLSVYFLGAAGTLTKGLPSVLFTGLSVLVFFIVNKDFRKLFSLAHFTGMLLYLALVGGYFLAYSRQGDAISYLLNLSVESGKRFSGDTFWDYLGHMFLYPLDTLMNLLPASVLIVFIFRKSFMKDIRLNSFMKFALLMLIVHFPVYWLPPGGRQRYIIMLYPFIIQILAYFFLLYVENDKRLFKAIAITITAAIGFAAAGCLVPLFTVKTNSIPGLVPLSLAAFAIMTSLFIFQIKKPKYSIFSLLFALVILRFLFGFAVLPIRATEGRAPENKAAALQIASITAGQKVCILKPTYFPMQSVFYFEKERNEILSTAMDVKPGAYYIVTKFILEKFSFYREGENNRPGIPYEFSDPFTGDDNFIVAEGSYEIALEFILQKNPYLLIAPVNPSPSF